MKTSSENCSDNQIDLEETKTKTLLAKEQEPQGKEWELFSHILQTAEAGDNFMKTAGNVWLSLKKFAEVTPLGENDDFILAENGPVAALATGLAKSHLCQKPKIEIHTTVCPSYSPPSKMWDKEKYPQHPRPIRLSKNPQVIVQWQEFLGDFSNSGVLPFVNKWYFHTPGPFDRKTAGVLINTLPWELRNESKPDWLDWHWRQTKDVVDAFTGDSQWAQCVEMVRDLELVEKFLPQIETFFCQPNSLVYKAFQIFKGNEVAAATRGKGWPEFCLFAGTVMAYGNKNEWFNLEKNDRGNLANKEPIRLFLHAEGTAGIYAGQKFGVDFRQLIPGYTLPFWVLKDGLRSPWAI